MTTLGGEVKFGIGQRAQESKHRQDAHAQQQLYQVGGVAFSGCVSCCHGSGQRVEVHRKNRDGVGVAVEVQFIQRAQDVFGREVGGV